MRHSTRAAAAIAALLLGAGALVSCTSSESAGEAPSDAASPTSEAPATKSPKPDASSPAATEETSKAAATFTITIKDFAYSGPSSVPPGAEITVVNEDTQAHTVTAEEDDAFDVKIDPGKSATFTAPDDAGSYAYICAFHSNMKASLKVA